MTYKNIVIKNRNGYIYHPETNINNIMGLNEITEKIKSLNKRFNSKEPIIVNNDNHINDIIEPGFYAGGKIQGSPVMAFYLKVMIFADKKTVFQEVFNRANIEESYRRIGSPNGEDYIWTEWKKMPVSEDIEDLKQSGVEVNRYIVDALNSNGIIASTNNNIKENSKKINALKVDRKWDLKNLNPDPLFEDLSMWERNGPVNLSVENNVLISEAGVDFKLYGLSTRGEIIELDADKTYNISFYIKKTNIDEETIISFTNENLVDYTNCDPITEYVNENKFTRYSYNFKPTQSGKHSLSIYSKNAKKGDKIYIKELMICESEEDELFVPPIREYGIGSKIKTDNIENIRNEDKNYKTMLKSNISINNDGCYAFDSEYNLYVLSSSYSSPIIKKYNSEGQFIKDIESDTLKGIYIHEFDILNNDTLIITTTNNKVYNIKEDGTVLWEKSYQFPMKRILVSRKEDYVYTTGYMNVLYKYNYSGRLILSRDTSFPIDRAIMSKDEYKYLVQYGGPSIKLFSNKNNFLKDFKLEKSNDNIKKFTTNNNNDLLFLTKENNIYILDETAERNSRLVLESDEKINDFIVDNYNNLYIAYDTGVIRQYTFNKLNWEINDLYNSGANKIFFGKDNLLYVAYPQSNFYIVDYPLRVIEHLITK